MNDNSMLAAIKSEFSSAAVCVAAFFSSYTLIYSQSRRHW